jgi:hypothetical protein
MPEAAPDLHPGYWAHSPQPAPSIAPQQAAACRRCSAEFLIGARYCHVCGAEREGTVRRSSLWKRLVAWARLEEMLEFNRFSLIAGLLGGVCLFIAALVGFLFRADTLVDWQAIQLWRIEWTLGAVALFLLAILLKK